jgi:hypothetical protein
MDACCLDLSYIAGPPVLLVYLLSFHTCPESLASSCKHSSSLFVWAVAGWLCRESCCVEKAAVQGKLLFQVLVFGNLAGCLAVKR